MNSEELLYAKTHEWVRIEDVDGGQVATVGISEFALQQLTDLVYIDLPQVGQQVTAGQPLGEIESVKAVSDLYSPVTGEIVDVNQALKDSLEVFSQDPYGAGWIAKIRVTDSGGLRDLMDASAYQKQCADEA